MTVSGSSAMEDARVSKTHRPAVEYVDQAVEDAVVGVIETEGIDTEAIKSLSRGLACHDAVALDLGVVADAAE